MVLSHRSAALVHGLPLIGAFPTEVALTLERQHRRRSPGLEMHVAVTLRRVSCGTELAIVQEGIPAAIPAEQCYLGWQESLRLLGQLVEAEVKE